MSALVLHNYFRSSTSYRVRIALAIKGLSYEYAAHHLLRDEHKSADYLRICPQGVVPTLVWDDGTALSQSLAIMEFLDEMVPHPAILPADPHGRARVRMLSQVIACDLHPVNNLRVLKDLRSRFGADDVAVAEWFRHWVKEAFEPLEAMLASAPQTGRFCHGDTPTMADICLVAQVTNNARFSVDMAPYPVIRRIHEACLEIPAFAEAAPAKQPDAE